jgi:signal transduction histidine kinase
MAASTLVAVGRVRAALRLRQMDAVPDHPRLLPAVLVPEHAGSRRTTRDWIVDVLCVIVAALLGAVVFADARDQNSLPDWFTFLDLVAGVVACLALWVRRRWPLGLALALALAGAVFSSTGGAALIAVFTLAVHRPVRQTLPVAALCVATQPIYLAIYPDSGGMPYIVALILSAVFIGAAVAWGMFVRARRQLVLSLRDRAQRAETEQQLRVEQARHQERARIAREMHDVLAHRISLLSLHAGALEFRPDAPSDEVARAAGVIRASAHEALQDLRAVIGVLREGPDGEAPERPQPTFAELPALIDESRAAGVRVSYDGRVPDGVPEGVGRNAYRIVQEGLTNARKHARGAAVDVRVAGAPAKGLEIEIRNPLPVGALAAMQIPGTGTGIVGLAERASLAGGRLEHGRTDAGEYRLWAWLPWPA